MSNARKRVTQKVRTEALQREDADESQSIRRLTPPQSPSLPGDSPEELTIEFTMDSFLPPTPGRTCNCGDVVCGHRYKGRIDDNMLRRFLADTRLMTEVAIERHPQFFKTPDTLHIGSLASLRKAVDPLDGITRVYLKRENISGKSTIIKFPFSELKQFLCDTLVPMYLMMTSVPKNKMFEKTLTHDYREKSFWTDELVKANPKGDIRIRPFLLNNSTLAVRIFQQLDKLLEIRDKNDVVNLWAGPTTTFLLSQFLQLVQKLGQLVERK